MSSIKIELDPDALREATAQAIMGVLTPEARTAMIEKAIIALLEPSTDSWDKGRSPLDHAFNDAVDKIAQEEALKVVANDPKIRLQLSDLMHETAEKIFNYDRDKLAERMSEAFVQSIKRDEY